MTGTDSNTFSQQKVTGTQNLIAGDIAALLKIPMGAKDDLFYVLNVCRRCVGELIETDNHVEYIALCGRLLAGFNVLRVVLDNPLPKYLIEQLTVEEGYSEALRTALETESETICDYCAALSMVLLNQQLSAGQQIQITDLLYEVFIMLDQDLKAPRFVRTKKGLAMIDGGIVSGVH
ncbi:Uncharacterised protein [Cedecea davisae]|nr:hypothetical protein [Cedecea davisae]SUX27842.1 Uncharacterised protein [Cedecea davisae]